jgi:phosphopantothenoylcysteine decarboxylase/phosphopantothenate--cysteine ligase
MGIKNKRILVGVTGGIAAYKMCDAINLLRKEGYAVTVAMTAAAEHFITPLTMETLSGARVYTDADAKDTRALKACAKTIDCVLVAPATANTIAKMAHGIADNTLTRLLSYVPRSCCVLAAPAMNTHMWQNPVTQKNIEVLRAEKRHVIIPPRVGRLACGDVGEGPMATVDTLVEAVKKHE